MNFDYSDDQKFLQEEVRKFLAHRCPIAIVRAVLEDPQESYDSSLWSSLAEMGWLGVTIPESHGGLGLSPLELCVIAEELGRVLAPVPFSSTLYLFAETLQRIGLESQRAACLPAIAAGKMIGCVAFAEGPGALQTTAITSVVENGRLTGQKTVVTDGDIADRAIVLAIENGHPALFLVSLQDDGVTRQTLKTLDPTRGAANLTFSRTPAERLGTHGDAAAQLARILDRAAVLFAFEQLGGADRCLEMARDYALERYTFGRPIGSYQAIKHKLVDMYIRNQLARSNAYYGAWALGDGESMLARAAAAARVAACEAYWFASKETIEIFGGIGVTWEADCHLFYRRAKQLSLVVGAAPVWKERLVAELERVDGA